MLTSKCTLCLVPQKVALKSFLNLWDGSLPLCFPLRSALHLPACDEAHNMLSGKVLGRTNMQVLVSGVSLVMRNVSMADFQLWIVVPVQGRGIIFETQLPWNRVSLGNVPISLYLTPSSLYSTGFHQGAYANKAPHVCSHGSLPCLNTDASIAAD